MTDVFISYSRKDIAFARLLHQALIDNNLETWIDWQDIPPSADWLAEVYEAIEGADGFVFIISETSLNSEICGLEIAHAASHNKRLIPIVIADIEAAKVPKELAALNWIFFGEAGERFSDAMEDLVTAITVDQEWVKKHTRLENQAVDWERRDHDRGLLLRGSNLTEAENWLSGAAGKDPQPTALQTQYILSSREDSTRRQRLTLIAVAAGLVVAVGLGILAWTQRNVAVSEGQARATAQAVAESASTQAVEQKKEAERQANIARAGMYSVEALSHLDDQFSLSLLLGIEAVNYAETVQSLSSLLTAISYNPNLLQVYYDHEGSATNLAYSPDGSLLVTAGCADPGPSTVTLTCSATELIFYDASAGDLIERVQTEHPVFVSDLEFSPDGSLIATSDWYGSIILWDASTRKPLGEPLFGRSGRVLDLAFSPDGNLLISSHEIINSSSNLIGGEIRLWDPRTGEQLDLIAKLTTLPYSNLLITPDGNNLITTQQSSPNMGLWDLDTWERNQEFFADNNSVVQSLALSPTGETLLQGNYDGSLQFRDLNDGNLLPIDLDGHTGSIIDMDYSPDGSTIITVSTDQTIRVWDAVEYVEIGDPFAQSGAVINEIAYHPEGDRFAAASADGSVTVWSLETLPAIARVFSGHSEPVWAVDTSRQENVIASASSDQTLRIWDFSGQADQARQIQGSSGQFYSIGFSPDGTLLAAGGQTGLEIWSWQAGERLQLIQDGHTAPIISLAFSPDGTLMATGGMDAKIILREMPGGEIIGKHLEGHQGTINGLAFSPDGKLLVSVGCAYATETYCEAGEIIVWEVGEVPHLKYRLSAHDSNIYAVAFSPDGSQFATGSSDETIRLWDSSSGDPDGDAIQGHEFGVVSAVYSPDGGMLVSGGLDNKIMLTDLVSRQRIGPFLSGHQGPVSSLAFSSSGEWLISGSHDSSVMIWPMTAQSWINLACGRAGRNFNLEEWQRYFPEEPYRSTCKQFP